MVTINEVESLKEDRSASKRKFTILCSRLRRGIQSKIYTDEEIRKTYLEFKNAYIDFLNLQDQYVDIVKEEDFEDYRIVNNLDLEEYLADVENNRLQTQAVYENYIENLAPVGPTTPTSAPSLPMFSTPSSIPASILYTFFHSDFS